jgi:acyl carrier protein
VTTGVVSLALVVLLALVFTVVAVWMSYRVPRDRVQQQFADRMPLSDEEFGASYFPARWGKSASRVRQIIGEALGIDMTRTRPSDRFVQDLRIDDLDSLASVEILDKLEEEFGIKITDDEALCIITIEELVRCVASKLDAKPCLPARKPNSLWDREFDG